MVGVFRALAGPCRKGGAETVYSFSAPKIAQRLNYGGRRDMRSLGAGENNVVHARHGGQECSRGVAQGKAVRPVTLHSRGRHGPHIGLKLIPTGTACLARAGGGKDSQL